MIFGQRRTYFIKKGFQTRFILRFVLVSTFWSVGTAALFAYLANQRLQELRFSSHVQVSTTGDLLLPISLGTHLLTLLIFAMILIYILRSLWKSLAVPLGRLKVAMGRMGEGDLVTPVACPDQGAVQELTDKFEGMRRGLKTRILSLEKSSHELNVEVATLSLAVAKKTLSSREIEEVQRALVRLQKSLGAFRT